MAAHQVPLYGISQERIRGIRHSLLQGIFPDPGIEPWSLMLVRQVRLGVSLYSSESTLSLPIATESQSNQGEEGLDVCGHTFADICGPPTFSVSVRPGRRRGDESEEREEVRLHSLVKGQALYA